MKIQFSRDEQIAMRAALMFCVRSLPKPSLRMVKPFEAESDAVWTADILRRVISKMDQAEAKGGGASFRGDEGVGMAAAIRSSLSLYAYEEWVEVCRQEGLGYSVEQLLSLLYSCAHKHNVWLASLNTLDMKKS